MDPILPVSSVGQPTVEALQAQMSRYTQLASVLSAQAITDYKALKTAMQSGNIPDALTALVQLQHDSNAADSVSAAPSSTFSTANSSGGDAGNTGSQSPNSEGLDATA
jgi:hypothetical protein